jgi:hypothetical protein
MGSIASQVSKSETAALPAVVATWLVLATILVALWVIGISPNGDADDVLKMHEIRHVLEGGSWFDRTLPGISQPEPLVSHWPWITDAPYAVIAWLLKPVLGLDTALQAAAFIVPLGLLGLLLWVLYRMNVLLGFAWPGAVLLVSALLSLTAFAEFQPGRIDYHNLQMLLLCASALLIMRGGARSAAGAGAVTALSFAISSEIAPFLVIPMAFLALRFVAGRDGGAGELRAFGAALAVGALAAFLMVTLPQGGSAAVCDRFALPHLLALGGAGLIFVAASLLPEKIGQVGRVAVLAIGAIAAAAALVVLFPICLEGPYGNLSPYLRQNWLMQIEQEMSLLAAPAAFTSGRLGKLVLALLGAGAGMMLGWEMRKTSRAWLVFGLYCALGLVISVAYVRYLRFLPLFATPGLVLLMYRLMPVDFSTRKWLAPLEMRGGSALTLVAPGVLVIAALAAWRGIFPPAEPPLSGIDIASACSRGDFAAMTWPAGSRVLAAPAVSMQFVGEGGAPDVVAIPFHTGAAGLERAYRFFDPATSDPKLWFDGAQATQVVVCRIEGTLPADITAAFPFAAGLATGSAPAWLSECPSIDAALRIYRTTGGVCPS